MVRASDRELQLPLADRGTIGLYSRCLGSKLKHFAPRGLGADAFDNKSEFQFVALDSSLLPQSARSMGARQAARPGLLTGRQSSASPLLVSPVCRFWLPLMQPRNRQVRPQ